MGEWTKGTSLRLKPERLRKVRECQDALHPWAGETLTDAVNALIDFGHGIICNAESLERLGAAKQEIQRNILSFRVLHGPPVGEPQKQESTEEKRPGPTRAISSPGSATKPLLCKAVA